MYSATICYIGRVQDSANGFIYIYIYISYQLPTLHQNEIFFVRKKLQLLVHQLQLLVTDATVACN